MSTIPLNLGQLRGELRSQLQARHLCRVGDTLELLAHGEANLIFRLNDDRLVRLAVNSPNQRFAGDASQVSAFEEAILRYLQGTGLSHELIGAQLQPSADFPYTYLLTNYIPGVPLDYGRKHLQQCAETLARLHRLPLQANCHVHQLIPPLQRVSHPLTLFFQESLDYARPYLNSPKADPKIVAMLEALLAKAEARLSAEKLLSEYPYGCLVHSDHTYENWVINEHSAYLIDWEWAEVGSPAGDLGHFLSPVTVCRRHGYQMPPEDKQFFLTAYYQALGDRTLAETIRVHFAVFGAFPALRSLCWTAGYWITANRWYAASITESTSAAARMERLRSSQQTFPQMWAEVMALLEEPLP
ncbi:MAG: phosphotransferase [Cyanobacteria bacterium P01_A01_bin.15]